MAPSRIASASSREQVRACLREPDEGAGLVRFGISKRALCVRLALPKVKAEFCPINMSLVYNFIAT